MVTEYHGSLLGFFETGTEGVLWALQKHGIEGYDGLVLLEVGDYLEIYAADGRTVFSGVLDPDRTAGTTKHRFSDYIQPSALGFWTHWTQRRIEPDVWTMYFIPESIREWRAGQAMTLTRHKLQSQKIYL